MPLYLPSWLHTLIDQTHEAAGLDVILDTFVPALKDFLEMDRVMFCQFESDEHMQVIAESTSHELPPLLLSRLKADYISPYSRETWQGLQILTSLDLSMQNIRQFSWESDSRSSEMKTYLPLNDQQKSSLTKLGVQFALIVPVFQRETVFGLLVAHSLKRVAMPNSKLEMLKTGADLLSVAINHQTLSNHQQQLQAKIQQKTDLEVGLNQLTSLLQSETAPNFQAALETVISTFQGLGARLCIVSSEAGTDSADRGLLDCLRYSAQALHVYKVGAQPAMPDAEDALILEQYPLWQANAQLTQHRPWPVTDIYQTPELSPLFRVFQPTAITALLMVPLTYRQKLVGYLSLFRGDTAPGGSEQTVPAQSWEKLEQIEKIARLFSMTLYEQYCLQKQGSLQASAISEVQQSKATIENIDQHQRQICELLDKVSQGKTDVKAIIQETTKAFCHSLNAERVSVYKFDENWGGEFIRDLEYAVPAWQRSLELGKNEVWNDSYLQDTQGGRYRHRETSAVNDIYQAGLSSCHVEILEQFGFKAFMIAPIFVGDKLWGLFSAYQHSAARTWQDLEVIFLRQIATAIGMAMEKEALLVRKEVESDSPTALSQKSLQWQQEVLTGILTRVNQGLPLATIAQIATKEICACLQVERVSVYKFAPDWGGEFLHDFEYVLPEWRRLVKIGVNTAWNDSYLQDTQGGRYRHNEMSVVDDVHEAGLSSCHVDILNQYEIKAFAIAPIFVGDKLWGLLSAYQHSDTHHWLPSETVFLSQIATALGLALNTYKEPDMPKELIDTSELSRAIVNSAPRPVETVSQRMGKP
ncbi:MAG: GAF domain-containing protein [Phormidesmis sp.]